jgi:hypothetical protein
MCKTVQLRLGCADNATMKTFSTLLLTGLLTFAAQGLRADTCEDIHNLSARWDKLATYIDGHSDDGKLRKSEVNKVISELKILVPPTRELGNVLVSEFKGKDEQRVQALGKQMMASLQEFAGLKDHDDDWDDVTSIFSHLVEVIDKVGDQCDK